MANDWGKPVKDIPILGVKGLEKMFQDRLQADFEIDTVCRHVRVDPAGPIALARAFATEGDEDYRRDLTDDETREAGAFLGGFEMGLLVATASAVERQKAGITLPEAMDIP